MPTSTFSPSCWDILRFLIFFSEASELELGTEGFWTRLRSLCCDHPEFRERYLREIYWEWDGPYPKNHELYALVGMLCSSDYIRPVGGWNKGRHYKKGEQFLSQPFFERLGQYTINDHADFVRMSLIVFPLQ